MGAKHIALKDLFTDYYEETKNQESLITSGDFSRVDESIDRRQTIIEKINSLDSDILRGKSEDIEVIIQRTIKLEKKNVLLMNAKLVDQRLKMKKHKTKKNGIMRYSMNR